MITVQNELKKPIKYRIIRQKKNFDNISLFKHNEDFESCCLFSNTEIFKNTAQYFFDINFSNYHS